MVQKTIFLSGSQVNLKIVPICLDRVFKEGKVGQIYMAPQVGYDIPYIQQFFHNTPKLLKSKYFSVLYLKKCVFFEIQWKKT